MPENLDRVIEIIERYRCRGILKGSQFLLGPRDAILLLEDLASAGVLLVSCSFWKYVDRQKGWIVEMYGEADILTRRLSLTDDRQKADDLKDILTNEVPPDVEFVSLDYDEVEIYALFRKYGQCEKSE